MFFTFFGPRPPTMAPRAAQDRTQRPHERARTASRGPRSAQGRQHRPQEPPKCGQDRLQRPQERPKTANKGPKSDPRPPTWAPKAAQDRQHRSQERPRPPTEAPRTGQDHLQRPVNFTTDLQSKMSKKQIKEKTCCPSTSRSTIHRKYRRKNT